MVYKAKYVNTSPHHSGEVPRDFTDRHHAERWLSSFSLGSGNEHYIDGVNVTEALKERRERYKQCILEPDTYSVEEQIKFFGRAVKR